MLVYLDWNIFNKIEHIEQLEPAEKITYTKLKLFLKDNNVFVPYSNAHLNDLFRGYKKNPNYIEGHLEIIKELTKDLCFCLYWNENKVTKHYRSVNDFFKELIDEKEYDSESFEDLLDEDFVEPKKQLLDTLALIQVPDNFKLIYKEDPIFNIIFPRTKVEMNHLSLCSDIYAFYLLLNKDYSTYKALKKFIIKAQHKFKKDLQILKSLKQVPYQTPQYLDIDEVIDGLQNKKKINPDNPHYHKIVDTFVKLDLKGFKTDSQFPNMFDDSIHTFYASHCDYFLTIDEKCQYKAKLTFEKSKVKTQVLSPEKFLEEIELK